MNDVVQRAATVILMTAFAIIVIGTVLIPAVAAHLFTWRWLFVYPATLAILIGASAAARRSK